MMSTGALRFCIACLTAEEDSARSTCGACGGTLRPFFDEQGAISGEFLKARGKCCGSGCRNCPYPATASNPVKQKTCERCGVPFECRSEGCWCEAVSLGPVTLASLRRTYADCLCPVCLHESAAISTERRR